MKLISEETKRGERREREETTLSLEGGPSRAKYMAHTTDMWEGERESVCSFSLDSDLLSCRWEEEDPDSP